MKDYTTNPAQLLGTKWRKKKNSTAESERIITSIKERDSFRGGYDVEYVLSADRLTVRKCRLLRLLNDFEEVKYD